MAALVLQLALLAGLCADLPDVTPLAPAGAPAPCACIPGFMPGLGAMQIISGVVAYDAPVINFSLEHRGVTATAEVSGVEAAELRFAVRRD